MSSFRIENYLNFYTELLSSEDYQLIPTYCDYQACYFADSFQDCSFVVSLYEKEALLVLCNFKDYTLGWFGDEIKFVLKGAFSLEEVYLIQKLASEKLSLLVDDFRIKHLLVNENFLFERYIGFEYLRSGMLVRSLVFPCLDYSETKSMLRKSYKSLINWGEKNLKTIILNDTNISEEIFESFRLFHIKVSGRETRSKETWDLQLAAILKKEAFLICCYISDHLVSAQYYIYGKKVAYYGVGVMDRDLMAQNLPLGHWPMIKAIKHLGELKVERLFLGSRQINDEINSKEEAIHKFKSGFTKITNYKAIITLKKQESNNA